MMISKKGMSPGSMLGFRGGAKHFCLLKTKNRWKTLCNRFLWGSWKYSGFRGFKLMEIDEQQRLFSRRVYKKKSPGDYTTQYL